MKLLVCDIEGTIFQPHRIKSAQHASYIWTAIAERLGKEAEREEIETQKKWRSGGYGQQDKGIEYSRWVEDSIKIHIKYGLTKSIFDELINKAPYVDGVKHFFTNLNRDEYIPVFISGGIQNLTERACRDLNVRVEDSYSACKYFFNSQGKVDKNLTFINTSNFYGKQELVKIVLKKYGLSMRDWIFIGDGINDVSVAKSAFLSIGIDPVEQMKMAADFSFANFNELMESKYLTVQEKILSKQINSLNVKESSNIVCQDNSSMNADELLQYAHLKVDEQVGKLNLPLLEQQAWNRMQKLYLDSKHGFEKNKFIGINDLLKDGQFIILVLENLARIQSISSAVLQPFCNAVEIMINVTLAHTEEKAGLNIIQNSLSGEHYSRKTLIGEIVNPDLRIVLKEYFRQRNNVSHSSQKLSVDEAKTIVQRSYESIQRLELLINPIELR